jgi:hypothetical protein
MRTFHWPNYRSLLSRGTNRWSFVQSPIHRPETLEQRTMLSVAINSAGSTVITPETGDRVIYCSSSTGSDGNSGLSASSPVQSLAAGEALLRNGYGDELLLKAGDVWQGSFVFWRLSGASAQNPMVLGSYGAGARPTLSSLPSRTSIASSFSLQYRTRVSITDHQAVIRCSCHMLSPLPS